MKKQVLYASLIIGCGLLFPGCSSSLRQDNHPEGQVFNVKVQRIETVSKGEGQSYIGTVEESVSVPLSFMVNGTIGKVLVEEGQAVTKGQLLAQINGETYRDAYRIACSKQQQAEDAYRRLEPLYKKGSLPEIKYVEIKTALEEAQSLTSIAKKNLRDCNLYAPISGMVGKRLIEPGMSAIMGNPVINLVKIETLKVTVPIPENEIAGISKGQTAFIRISALGDKVYQGKVSEIGVLSSMITHTYPIKISLKNQGGKIKPGMVCQVTIQSPALQHRLIVPMSAVQTDGAGNNYVLLAVSNGTKVARRSVHTGPVVENGVVIAEGLEPGDLVIVEGNQKIDAHSTIKLLN